jgi:hypothetical protein
LKTEYFVSVVENTWLPIDTETAKLQWLQDPSEINGDNLKNVRYEASRHFPFTGSQHISRKVTRNISES